MQRGREEGPAERPKAAGQQADVRHTAANYSNFLRACGAAGPLGVSTPCPTVIPMVSLGNVSQLQCRVCALTLYSALDRLWELPLYCSGGRPGWVLLRIPP